MNMVGKWYIITTRKAEIFNRLYTILDQYSWIHIYSIFYNVYEIGIEDFSKNLINKMELASFEETT